MTAGRLQTRSTHPPRRRRRPAPPPRDPLAEIFLRAPRALSSRSWTVPVRNPDGRTVWLTTGQFAVLLYVRRRRYRADTLARIAAAIGCYAGTVTHRLDTLAAFGLLGRHSRRGRGRRTRFWPPRVRPAGNVATPTGYAGLNHAWISREGVRRWALRSGRPPPPGSPHGSPGESEPGRRGSRPPFRLSSETCPRGHRVRLARWRWTWARRQFVGVWEGTCPRCGVAMLVPVVVDLPRRSREPVSAGSAAAEALRRHGLVAGLAAPLRVNSTPHASPLDNVTPERQAAAAEFLRLLDDVDQRDDLAERYGLEDRRERPPLDLRGLTGEQAAERWNAWMRGVRSVGPRYSQPDDVAGDPPPSVRNPQGGPIDGGG